ncbi:MAG: hypothetical protein ABSE35_03915 [Bryobacteraceae bacterium]|jgi:hypothetical protein
MKPFLTIIAAGLLLAGCSEQPAPPAAAKKEEAKPEPATGQSALFKMYQVARAWAPDAAVLKMDSVRVEGVADQPGKSAGWEAVFTSEQRASSHAFTWYAVDQEPTIHKGVFGGSEESYSGAHGATTPFLIADVKIDTDAALATAKGKEEAFEKKNPGQPVIYLLEKSSRFANPAWRVIWGESVSTSGFSVFVDASSGTFLEIMH